MIARDILLTYITLIAKSVKRGIENTLRPLPSKKVAITVLRYTPPRGPPRSIFNWLSTMSARILASSGNVLTAALTRRPTASFTASRRLYSPLAPASLKTAGGLLRIEPTRMQRTQLWPSQIYRSHSNAIRAISFARFLPKLVVKFARVPALFGGATVAGLAYVQYQAQRGYSLKSRLP